MPRAVRAALQGKEAQRKALEKAEKKLKEAEEKLTHAEERLKGEGGREGSVGAPHGFSQHYSE